MQNLSLETSVTENVRKCGEMGANPGNYGSRGEKHDLNRKIAESADVSSFSFPLVGGLEPNQAGPVVSSDA